jgi:hypothetical protein
MSMRFIHHPHDADVRREGSATAQDWLEIRSGHTHYPRRPLVAARFLIGSGSNCHLQLGGDWFPILHSVLVRTDSGWMISAVVPEPQLIVEGRICRDARLDYGDVIGIGPFEFILCHRLSDTTRRRGDEDRSETPGGSPNNAAREQLADVTNLSARELVGRLCDDVRLVLSYEAGRRRSGQALLRALRRQSQQAGEASPEGSIRTAAARAA